MEMSTIVPVIGYLMLAIGLLVMALPGKFKGLLSRLATNDKLYVAALFRVVVGILFVMVSPETRWPMFIRITGAVMIFAGVVIPIMGKVRIKAFALWWLNQGDGVIRAWAIVGMALGALLVYAR
jgi:hypothetical protein